MPATDMAQDRTFWENRRRLSEAEGQEDQNGELYGSPGGLFFLFKLEPDGLVSPK